MRLWLGIVATVLVIVGVYFLAKLGRHEGYLATYRLELQKCEERWPRYRCVVELARYFPDVQP